MTRPVKNMELIVWSILKGGCTQARGRWVFRVTITDWSEQEERPGMMKQVILPRPTVDREGCSSATGGHTAVTMLSAQPVAAGLSDPIAVHRSVHVHDNVSLGVSGPVSRIPIPSFDRVMSLKC